MPRVTHVTKARKDNPVCKKGESYFWWKHRYGGKRYSLTRPRPSQLTQSAYYSAIRSLIERIEDEEVTDNDSFVSLRDGIAEELQNIGSECQDSLDNMPDSLQYSPTGELLQERVDACENANSEVECADEFDEEEPSESDFDNSSECDDCSGTGYEDEGEDEEGNDEEMCLTCSGSGEVEDTSEYYDAHSNWETERDDFIEGCKDVLMEAVANCEV